MLLDVFQEVTLTSTNLHARRIKIHTKTSIYVEMYFEIPSWICKVHELLYQNYNFSQF